MLYEVHGFRFPNSNDPPKSLNQYLFSASFHDCRASLYSATYDNNGKPPSVCGGTNRNVIVVAVHLSGTTWRTGPGTVATRRSIDTLAVP